MIKLYDTGNKFQSYPLIKEDTPIYRDIDLNLWIVLEGDNKVAYPMIVDKESDSKIRDHKTTIGPPVYSGFRVSSLTWNEYNSNVDVKELVKELKNKVVELENEVKSMKEIQSGQKARLTDLIKVLQKSDLDLSDYDDVPF